MVVSFFLVVSVFTANVLAVKVFVLYCFDDGSVICVEVCTQLLLFLSFPDLTKNILILKCNLRHCCSLR